MSSVEYAELAGLKIALSNMQANPAKANADAAAWMQHRVKELTSK